MISAEQLVGIAIIAGALGVFVGFGIGALRERVALMPDALRYRWLRATTNFVTNTAGERLDVRGQPQLWDEAIDEAMRERTT